MQLPARDQLRLRREFDRALAGALEAGGPTLVHARIQPGSMDKLGRPAVTPEQVARRFQSFMTSG